MLPATSGPTSSYQILFSVTLPMRTMPAMSYAATTLATMIDQTP